MLAGQFVAPDRTGNTTLNSCRYPTLAKLSFVARDSVHQKIGPIIAFLMFFCGATFIGIGLAVGQLFPPGFSGQL